MIRDALEKMNLFSEDEIEFVIKQNVEFIKSSTLMEKGGSYSEGEIDWYSGMLKEIEEKIKKHQDKRREMSAEISNRCVTKREHVFKKFKESQIEAVDEFSAKEATGKVFGRPRRAAQEIVRSELTMCMNVANVISNTLDGLREEIDKFHSKVEHATTEPEVAEAAFDTLSRELRFKLMSLRSCCYFYGIYLDAFKDDSPVEELRRVSYDETKVDLELGAEEMTEDDSRKIKELEIMGKMYYRGKDIKYLKKIEEMEKAVVSESAKLYTGKYAKFIEGAGLTKVLKDFVVSLRSEMEEFRLSAIRELRNLTDGFSEIIQEMNSVLFGCVNLRSNIRLSRNKKVIQKEWSVKYKESESQKDKHMNNLRPNLSHPENAGELEDLVKSEESRKVTILERVGNYKQCMIDVYFKECNAFFLGLINNLNFLMLFYDKWILNEDYIKLPGDENVEKRHMNLRKLMIKKEKGDLVDTSSERSIKKAWKGFPI